MPEQLTVFKSLQHPARLKILKFLGQHPNDVQYSDLLPFCEDSTGKLNYHLRNLEPFIHKTDIGYNLSENGEKVLSWVQNYDNKNYVSDFTKPTILFNKIYPASDLLRKYWIQASIIFLLLFAGSGFITYLVQSYLPLIIMMVLYMIVLYSIKLYVDSIWYRITDTEIEVFKGFITHTHKIVPYRTVTNLDLKAGPFDRIFSLSTIDIQTAGSSANQIGPEEKLVGMVEGEEVKDTIIERIRLLNPIDLLQREDSKGQDLKNRLEALRSELADINKELSG